jgi:uncharacterized protein YyaL (SSP411 family)
VDERERAVLDKLLSVRRSRPQPTVDTKIVTSWNCLAAVALIEAGRRLGNASLIGRAEEIEAFLLAEHYRDGRLLHSSNDGAKQHEEFLEDVAAFFLLETYLLEERQFRDGEETRARCEKLSERLSTYRDGDSWFEAKNADFMAVPAQAFDSPTPSSISLATLAETRFRQLSGEFPEPQQFRSALANDFSNFAAAWSAGFVHEVHSPTGIPYEQLPVNVVQIRDEQLSDCFRGVCRFEVPRRSD